MLYGTLLHQDTPQERLSGDDFARWRRRVPAREPYTPEAGGREGEAARLRGDGR